jgi:hypothetical protein
VRHDVDLARVGEVGDVPATSPIQLGTEGRYRGAAFVVVGRIAYEYERGHWNEWHLRLSDGTGAWLSDAQAEYAVTRQEAPSEPLPWLADVRIGRQFPLGGTRFEVASITKASYVGVEGELPFEYWDKSEIVLADLRSPTGAFATLDYSEPTPLLFVGEPVTARELDLSNLREPTAEATEDVRRVRGLNCPQCGAAIELRSGDLARSVVCSACTAVLDPTDPSLRVLQKAKERTRVVPTIPLGTTGTLSGVSWQAIGFQMRSITVEGLEYPWREYLLWNPEEGFRYLTEYHGHWNFVAVLKGTPEKAGGGTQPTVRHLDRMFRHFQSATATTRFVLGEFPWQARIGDTASVNDYVAPPYMLSREVTPGEATWSISTYTAPERIWKAFGLDGQPPRPVGVFANQPNPQQDRIDTFTNMLSAFVVALVLLGVLRGVTARNERVFEESYGYDQVAGDTSAFVTPTFELKGHTSNVELAIRTTLDNNWAYFSLALIDEGRGTAYDFGREVGYYQGIEGGERWHEGSTSDRSLLPAVPPGRYYLRVEPEAGRSLQPFVYTLTMRRDAPRLWPFALAFLLLAAPMAFALLSAHSFETRRWQESDHAPASSSDD